MKNDYYKSGKAGQEAVSELLNQNYGISTKKLPYNSSFDVLVGGVFRIEIKTARCCINKGVPRWRFNIHRHGKMTEEEVDFYILRLENVPYHKSALHLLVPSPAKSKIIEISIRSLLNKHSKHIQAFQAFCEKLRPSEEK